VLSLEQDEKSKQWKEARVLRGKSGEAQAT
jgi:hypothetical protein